MIRTALATTLLALPTVAFADADDSRWHFEVLLDERPIGHQTNCIESVDTHIWLSPECILQNGRKLQYFPLAFPDALAKGERT